MSQIPDQIQSLWAPWRVEYFKRTQPAGDFLLDAAQTSDDAAHLVVARRKSVFLIMNRYPYCSGHLMAVPNRQVAQLDDLAQPELMELWEMAILAQRLLREVVGARGFNIGLNIGACAGAGVADHLHLHIVPRWEGDNNFMPVIADMRIIPEALEDLYGKLRDALIHESADRSS